MSNSGAEKNPAIMLDEILRYVEGSSGLSSKLTAEGKIQVVQSVDKKIFGFDHDEVAEVLSRADGDGKPFLQVNFQSGSKVLLTDNLIGFKPSQIAGLDMGRIPKVVTTPDLVSVFEAIEETLGADVGNDSELEVLKKVFFAILGGGELAGFDLGDERKWISRLIASRVKVSA